jgi:hypothetical protein
MEFIQGFSNNFIIAYVAGGIFLLLFCVDRFDEPVKKGSFVETLVPRHLATHSEYLRTFLIYYVIMWAIYTLLTLIGPSFMQLFQPDTQGFTRLDDLNAMKDPFKSEIDREDYPTWFPLAVVLVLAGAASSRYPFFNTVELIVRRLTHRIIGIPDGIQHLAENLNRAQINLAALSESEAAFIKSKYHSVTGEVLDDINNYYEHAGKKGIVLINWIRLNFLFNIIENKQRELPRGFDTAILRSYDSMWMQVKSAIYDLTPRRVTDSLVEHTEDTDYTDRERTNRTREDVDNSLHSIHAIIAACVAQSVNHEDDLARIMKALRLTTPPKTHLDFSQAFVAAFVVVFAFVFLVVFATPLIIDYLVDDPSGSFPRDKGDAFSWATSTIFLHGAAAVSALRYRQKLGKRWQKMRIRSASVPATQYVWVMALAYVAATIGLGLWWFVQQAIVSGLALPTEKEGWIPLFGVLGIATGFWVSYSLDVAEREETISRGRMVLQAVYQGATTGLISSILLSMLPAVELDFLIYTSTVAALAGFLIGLIVIVFVRVLYLKEDEQDAQNPP